MTILTDKERESGMAELAGVVPTDADVQYFRDKIIKGLQRNVPAVALEKTFKQLTLIEDAVIIYHEQRPSELLK